MAGEVDESDDTRDDEENEDTSSGDDDHHHYGGDPSVQRFAARKVGKNRGIRALIEEKHDAAGTFVPLTASIYQMAALGMKGTYFTRGTDYDSAMGIVALWTIPVIQLLGPCAIAVWAFYQLDWARAELRWPLYYVAGSQTAGLSCLFNSLLSSLLLFLVCLYSVASVSSDDESLLKLRLLIWACKKQRENDNFVLKRVCPFINTYVAVMVCVDMFLLFLLSDSPRTTLFDSLGLLFLHNLDDIPGHVDTLLPHWPDQTAGNVYWCNVYAKFASMQFRFSKEKHNTSRGVANPDRVYSHCREVQGATGVGGNCIYLVGNRVLRLLTSVLPVVFLLLHRSVNPMVVEFDDS